MIQTWQLHEAKNKLSQLIDKALDEGPQLITRHGETAVIVLAYPEYKRLTGADESLYDFLRRSPLVGVDLDLSREDESIPDRFLP
jgi:prevent-host-death family protein